MEVAKHALSLIFHPFFSVSDIMTKVLTKVLHYCIAETPYPSNKDMIFIYSAFIKGDHTYFDIEPSGMNGTELYPHIKYTTISDYLDTLL